jgi:hypothetical protein
MRPRRVAQVSVMSLWFDQSSDNLSRLKPGVAVSDPNVLGKILFSAAKSTGSTQPTRELAIERILPILGHFFSLGFLTDCKR